MGEERNIGTVLENDQTNGRSREGLDLSLLDDGCSVRRIARYRC